VSWRFVLASGTAPVVVRSSASSDPTATRRSRMPGPELPDVTVTVTSSFPTSAPSSARRRRTYVPTAENLALVLTDVLLPHVIEPGPETLDQLSVVAPGGVGSPSSVTAPFSCATFGNTTD
jgi:hypothetical protein